MDLMKIAADAPWAMLPERVEQMLSIAAREHEIKPEALQAYAAAHSERGERLKVRDGVGILEVSGPLFKRANLFVRISGATSYEILRRDLQAALDDPSVDSILLDIDSPGGEANGCDELAQAIFDARGVKPITAFVSGMACSGGYWLASAADQVVVSDAAILGSIGVVLGVAARGEDKRVEFVSSKSPGKRPDVSTDEGRARIQKMVDDLGDVFIAAVARNRGVSPETVAESFGAGGVEIGANAVAAGMADKVGQFEATFQALVKRGRNRRNNRSNGGFHMSEKNGAAAETEIDVAKIEADAAAKATAATLARVKAIQTSDEGKARPKLAEHLAFNTQMSVDDALGVLKAAAEEAPATADSFAERKQNAGTLGLGTPDARDGQNASVQDGWARAAAAANARFGADAVN